MTSQQVVAATIANTCGGRHLMLKQHNGKLLILGVGFHSDASLWRKIRTPSDCEHGWSRLNQMQRIIRRCQRHLPLSGGRGACKPL